MTNFQNYSFNFQRAVDVLQQEKDKVSILEQMQINENLTLNRLNALQQKILDTIQAVTSNSRAELKSQFDNETSTSF